MRSLRIELPEKLAMEVESLVEAGWFQNADELIRMALMEFLRRHRLELAEHFMREDIEWALGQKKGAK
jgi:Arc/MetJ-type ribon-helix-helix transcriptional regulator